MTINGLWGYIRKNYPEVLELVPQRSFKGRRVAIDAFNLFYIIRSIVRRKIVYSRDIIAYPLRDWNGKDDIPDKTNEIDIPWLKSILDYILPWLQDGITPILTLDGPHQPEKAGTHEKRKAKTDKSKEKLAALNMSIQTYGYNKNLVKDMQDALCGEGMVHVPARSIKLAEDFFKALGIPVVQALGDGEQLCSALCRCGIAAAVFSSDGDNLAHGCPILIRDKADSMYIRDPVMGMQFGVAAFSIIRMEKLLQCLQMTQTMFTEWCIMCGCDYNANMPGIATVKSLNLIRAHGSIDNLPYNYDSSCLVHRRCRQLFAPTENVRALVSDGSIDIQQKDVATITSILTKYGLPEYTSKLATSLANVPPSNNFRHSFYNPPLTIDPDSVDSLDNIAVMSRDGEPTAAQRVKNAKKKKPAQLGSYNPIASSIPNGGFGGPGTNSTTKGFGSIFGSYNPSFALPTMYQAPPSHQPYTHQLPIPYGGAQQTYAPAPAPIPYTMPHQAQPSGSHGQDFILPNGNVNANANANANNPYVPSLQDLRLHSGLPIARSTVQVPPPNIQFQMPTYSTQMNLGPTVNIGGGMRKPTTTTNDYSRFGEVRWDPQHNITLPEPPDVATS